MPSHYQYRCSACGKVETRYRNARLSRCCRAPIARVAPRPATLADLDEILERDPAYLRELVKQLRADNERLTDLLTSIRDRIDEWTRGPHVLNVWGPLVVMTAEIESALKIPPRDLERYTGPYTRN